MHRPTGAVHGDHEPTASITERGLPRRGNWLIVQNTSGGGLIGRVGDVGGRLLGRYFQ